MKYKSRNNKLIICLMIMAGGFTAAGYGQVRHASPVTTASRPELAAQLRHSLFSDLLNHWYPEVVDTVYGGYLSNLSYDFKPFGRQNKFIVTQARQVWTLSRVVSQFPEYRAEYKPMAKQGVAFLRDKMWDKQDGGFYSLVTRQGTLIKSEDGFTGTKTAYGNAFAIYALAEYAKVFKDTTTLDLAKRAFRWLDNHAHDPKYGGYFQNIRRNGTPYKDGFHGIPPKDQNSTIHLLEAFTGLYTAWPDPTLKSRISELLNLLQNKIINKKHYYLGLFFKRDWTHISYRDSVKNGKAQFFPMDYVSFGHNVETAWLMLDAAKTIGADTGPVLKTGKAMVDEALENGWDEKRGGIYNAGYYVKEDGPITIVQYSKDWWPQAEMLNSLLLMSDYYPEDPHHYYQHFLKQWQYINRYIIDHKHGGWYRGGIDEQPQMKKQSKGGIWKGAYHDSRALMNCIARLTEKKGPADSQ